MGVALAKSADWRHERQEKPLTALMSAVPPAWLIPPHRSERLLFAHIMAVCRSAALFAKSHKALYAPDVAKSVLALRMASRRAAEGRLAGSRRTGWNCPT